MIFKNSRSFVGVIHSIPSDSSSTSNHSLLRGMNQMCFSEEWAEVSVIEFVKKQIGNFVNNYHDYNYLSII